MGGETWRWLSAVSGLVVAMVVFVCACVRAMVWGKGFQVRGFSRWGAVDKVDRGRRIDDGGGWRMGGWRGGSVMM
jgi:hypothetical protein